MKNYWAGTTDENDKEKTRGANHSRNAIKKSLKELESWGLFTLNDEREKPIYQKIKGEAQFRSPYKLFRDLNIEAIAEAYEALEQLLNQYIYSPNPRKIKLPIQKPKHAGMIVRLVFTALMKKAYRAFSKLPESLSDMVYNNGSQQLAIAKYQIEVRELDIQFEEYSRLVNGASSALIHERRVEQIGKMKQKAMNSINAIKQEMMFAELPY
jgi:hypothetical protein